MPCSGRRSRRCSVMWIRIRISLDPKRVEELITPRTTGILAVHTWGRPAAIEALQEIADRRGLKLLFDGAHALACTATGSHDRRLRHGRGVLQFPRHQGAQQLRRRRGDHRRR
ncbi:MAG: DegT/DnrJ/EryC1/StrS family aminotransferase [Planctomycetota bacterium]